MIGFILILVLFGISIGIFASALVLRLGPASEWFVWPIPAVLAPFVGVFYPLSVLPLPMQIIGRALPASYVFEGMRSVVLHGTVDITAMLIGSLLAAIYVLLACWVFSRIYYYAVDTGLLARYSAETIN